MLAVLPLRGKVAEYNENAVEYTYIIHISTFSFIIFTGDRLRNYWSNYGIHLKRFLQIESSIRLNEF